MMRSWLLFLLFIGSKGLLAQDVQYSQFYANPLFLNPAFAGSTEMARLGVNFRNQWPALDESFVAYTAYADIFSERFQSGKNIGVR